MSALPPIVLASASPRRRELLAGIGLVFDVLPTSADETPPTGATPAGIVEELARRKAELAQAARPDALLIACDTLVFLDGAPLEKPRDRNQALDFLNTLAGREHSVFSGLAVYHAPRAALRLASRETKVSMRALSEREITRYVDSGEPFDKAGGYGIQGRGALLIDSIQGDYYNVMGLPLTLLDSMLLEFGISLLDL
jgi:septum formation protein